MKSGQLFKKIARSLTICGLLAFVLVGLLCCASPDKFALPPPKQITSGIGVKAKERLATADVSQMLEKRPDIIVTDMWFVLGDASEDTEFPYQYLDLRVTVKNIGTEKAKFLLHMFKTDPTKGVGFATPTGIVFEQQAPSMPVSLAVGEEKTYEWKSVGKLGDWAGYFLAVADIPTQTWRLGQETEGPLPMAEQNNTMAIPFPTKQ